MYIVHYTFTFVALRALYRDVKLPGKNTNACTHTCMDKRNCKTFAKQPNMTHASMPASVYTTNKNNARSGRIMAYYSHPSLKAKTQKEKAFVKISRAGGHGHQV